MKQMFMLLIFSCKSARWSSALIILNFAGKLHEHALCGALYSSVVHCVRMFYGVFTDKAVYHMCS